ncbi:MAG: DUF4340 domain-containing protein [Lachnobacterium sp.]|nr:DUF4340 domain-containing protein [Lachnobacterium sp.]MCI7087247.1 DUF4340 domain-containing protein [Lachnobacterium sp.]MCI7532037.1 DUF4340 domain-containing protein [Lachnobacterium sp.]
MKKQKIQMLVIVVILLLCIVAYFLATRYAKQQEQRDKDSETQGQVNLTVIDPDDVDAFSYIADGTTYSYTKNKDTWTCENDTSLKMDADSIATLLGNLKKITAAEAIDDYDSIADYGLDQPQNTITVTCGNETTTIDIGDYNEMLQEYYIKISGDDKIYLADSTLKDAFSKKPDTMVQQEESTETESVDSTQS